MKVSDELEGWKRLIDTAAFIWLRKRDKFSDLEVDAPDIEMKFYGIPKDVIEKVGVERWREDFSQAMRQAEWNVRTHNTGIKQWSS